MTPSKFIINSDYPAFASGGEVTMILSLPDKLTISKDNPKVEFKTSVRIPDKNATLYRVLSSSSKFSTILPSSSFFIPIKIRSDHGGSTPLPGTAYIDFRREGDYFVASTGFEYLEGFGSFDISDMGQVLTWRIKTFVDPLNL